MDVAGIAPIGRKMLLCLLGYSILEPFCESEGKPSTLV
jgi:hypothetical protein